MKKGIRPGTEMRLALSKYCREKGMPSSSFLKIILPMRGKTDQEKEKMAMELLEKVKRGEIPLEESTQ